MWGNVKLKPSLLMATLRVHSTLHLPNLGLILNSRVCFSMSLWLCSLYFSDPRVIWSLLIFHPPHGLIIICIICTGGLKIFLSTQVNTGILEYSNKEVAIWEYKSYALATCNHVHHHQISQMDSYPNQNGIYKECLVIGNLISVSIMW